MQRSRKIEPQVRNKGYEESHRAIVETAIELISQSGVEAVTIAGIARRMGIDRTTVYYHFKTRDALLQAVFDRATQQLAKGMDISMPEQDRARQIGHFVLENPALIKLWIEGFVSKGDIRDSYTRWDDLVEGIRQHFARERPDEEVDVEVYCTMMLCAAIIGPRVFANSVRPDQSIDTIVQRFLKEEQRQFRRDGLLVQK